MVWFAGDARRSSAADLYSAFTGQEPDSFQSNKVPSGPIPVLSGASGLIDDLAYSVAVQTSRVDLVVQGKNDEAADSPVLITSPDKLIEKMLRPQVLSIGSQLTSINRLALVTTLCQPVDSHAAANELVADLVDVKLPRFDVTDLAFQVNARVPMDGPSGVQVNRFLKFGVMAFHTVTLELGSQVLSPQEAQKFSASLAIDVNIVPHFQPLQPSLQAEVWDKLVEETIRLRSIGKLDGLW